MKQRQQLIVTLNQLSQLQEEIFELFPWKGNVKYTDDDKEFRINLECDIEDENSWRISGVDDPHNLKNETK